MVKRGRIKGHPRFQRTKFRRPIVKHIPPEQEAEKPIPGKPKPQYRPGFGPQNKNVNQPGQFAPNAGKNILTIFVIIIVVVFFIYMFSPNRNSSNQNSSPSTNPTNNPSSPSSAGLCSSNNDCANFGSRNCGGAAYTRCYSQDSMCRCCLTVISGGSASCVACSNNCPGLCIEGVCVFDIPGKTTD